MPFIPTSRPDHCVEGLICQFATSGIKVIAKIVALYHNLPYANCDVVPNITSSEPAYGEIKKENVSENLLEDHEPFTSRVWSQCRVMQQNLVNTTVLPFCPLIIPKEKQGSLEFESRSLTLRALSKE